MSYKMIGFPHLDTTMYHATEMTIRFYRTLGVIITLLAMLFVSSAQGAFEESSEESTSHEIELVVGRREVRPMETREPVGRGELVFPVVARLGKLSRQPFFAAQTERSGMNGSGTFLLI